MTGIWFTLIAILLVQLYLVLKLNRLGSIIREIRLKQIHDSASHQARIANRRSTSRNPQVDADARTSRRDTNDIPVRGGRMRPGVERKKTNGRNRDDS